MPALPIRVQEILLFRVNCRSIQSSVLRDEVISTEKRALKISISEGQKYALPDRVSSLALDVGKTTGTVVDMLSD